MKSSPHHGQLSKGMGDGLPAGLLLYWLTLLRAESERPSPFAPRWFGVPALPTQRPISKGQAPSRAVSRRRSSSSAQTSPAARPS